MIHHNDNVQDTFVRLLNGWDRFITDTDGKPISVPHFFSRAARLMREVLIDTARWQFVILGTQRKQVRSSVMSLACPACSEIHFPWLARRANKNGNTLNPRCVPMNKLLPFVLGLIFFACVLANVVAGELSEGVALRPDEKSQGELAKRIDAAPKKAMASGGLAGAKGGIRVRLASGAPQEILFPIPQLADGQVPICFFIHAVPAEAVTEFRIRQREDGNVVISAKMTGKDKEIQIAWSAVVLVAGKEIAANATKPDVYRAASPCVQSDAEEIAKLAESLWPESKKPAEFAANIQKHIREMKRKDRPRSLDALGILKSGESGICTANSNLAAALMRAKGIACRSIAVIPPISQRLEMHRIVEYYDADRWQPFDPSSVQPAIPSNPWHNIILSKTTMGDEKAAMKPRMGVMVGCPYGQELEMITPNVLLFGQDFFWTEAKPLAEFEASDEAIKRATEAWKRYLESGVLSAGKEKAATARSSEELLKLFRSK